MTQFYRMSKVGSLILAVTIFSLIVINNATNNEEACEESEKADAGLQRISSPTLEVLMHLPPPFRNVRSLETFLGGTSMKNGKIRKRSITPKKLVDVRSYKITQPVNVQKRFKDPIKRPKREAHPTLEKPTLINITSEKPNVIDKKKILNSVALLPVADALRGPSFQNYPIREFDVVDIDDPEDPRRRKNDSTENQEDASLRDKRTFSEGEAESGDNTTPVPFWKKKKENLPFITGRGSSRKNSDYLPPQHRSADNARESHSLKNFDNTIQENNIGKSHSDSYLNQNNRRAYSRQSDNSLSSTPKSVYDTIDFNSSKKYDQTDKGELNRIHERKETLRDGRPYPDHYNKPFVYNYPNYERQFYQNPYPVPSEVIGRGVEYYHQAFEPSSRRIIYYPHMPENSIPPDYRFMYPTGRSFYGDRPFMYDQYNRQYPPPLPYAKHPYDDRYFNGFRGNPDFISKDRSRSRDYYMQPYQSDERYTRDPRYIRGQFGYDKGNQIKEVALNKTYIIYDADYNQFPPKDRFYNDRLRQPFAPPPNNFQRPQTVFNPPPADYFPRQQYPFRNEFYPAQPPPQNHAYWDYRHGPPPPGNINSDSTFLHPPQVQIPLTASHRSLDSPAEFYKNKKS